MPKMRNNKKNKNDTKYNADNEIIIGVTTKPKEKVRVEKKKTTRTITKTNKNKTNKSKSQNTKKLATKNKKGTPKNKVQATKEKQIRKLNIKKIIISIAIVLFLAICGTIYYLTTPVFNVASINVYGNEKNSIDTYISLSGININETNIFAFTNSSVIKRIKQNPYVEEARIEKKLPNILELHITERTIDYQVKYLSSYIYLNNQGYVLEINEAKSNVLLIEGINSIQEDIKVGQRLTNEDLVKLDTILKVTNYIKYNGIERELTKVNVSQDGNFVLEFKKENKIAYIGDSSSITEKMTSVTKILEIEEGKAGKIYANEDVLKKNRVYFSEEKIDLED